MNTTREERDEIAEAIDSARKVSPGEVSRLLADADRLAQYERDLHDDVGKDRSQDVGWLRAGFLQRGAEIERLEDGIRALADKWENEDVLDSRFAFTPSECAQQARDLLDGE